MNLDGSITSVLLTNLEGTYVQENEIMHHYCIRTMDGRCVYSQSELQKRTALVAGALTTCYYLMRFGAMISGLCI